MNEVESAVWGRNSFPSSLALILALGATATLVCGIVMAVSLWRVMPFYDSWSMVTTFIHQYEGSLSFCLVIAQQNEHRIVMHRLLALLDLAYFRGTHALLYPVLVISYVGVGGFIGWLIATSERQVTVYAMIVISSMALLISPAQMDNLAQPVQTGMAHVILFSGIAFVSIGLLAECKTRLQQVFYTAISAIAIILAAFSMLQGVVGAALAVILSCFLRVPLLSRTVLVAVLVACVVVYFFWPCGYRWPAHHQPFFASFNSMAGIGEFSAHVAIHLGMFAGFLGLKQATIIGTVGLALWLLALLATGRRWWQSRQIEATLAALMGISTLMVAAALITAIGRAGFGSPQASSSRYATEGLALWLCLIGVVWKSSGALDNWTLRPATARHVRSSLATWPTRLIAPSLVARSLIVCVTSVIIVLSYYAWFSVIGHHWRQVVAQNRLLAQELRMGIFDLERARSSFPVPERIHGFLKFIKENKLSIFAE